MGIKPIAIPTVDRASTLEATRETLITFRVFDNALFLREEIATVEIPGAQVALYSAGPCILVELKPTAPGSGTRYYQLTPEAIVNAALATEQAAASPSAEESTSKTISLTHAEAKLLAHLLGPGYHIRGAQVRTARRLESLGLVRVNDDGGANLGDGERWSADVIDKSRARDSLKVWPEFAAARAAKAEGE